jgi:hypothetical protein
MDGGLRRTERKVQAATLKTLPLELITPPFSRIEKKPSAFNSETVFHRFWAKEIGWTRAY